MLNLLFCACIDRNGIGNLTAVDQVRSRLLGALECQLSSQHPSQPGLFNLTISFLPHLYSLGASHYAQLGRYRGLWQHLPNLPALYAELFDIPISQEEEIGVDGGIVFDAESDQ